MSTSFYDGTKLLSLKDLDGNRPEIYICTTNRSAGKTTYFNRYCMNRFLKYGEKFMILYRFAYELDNVGEKFFKDIKGLFFPGYDLRSEKKNKGAFHSLILHNLKDDSETECGYAVALNNSDQLKKYSHFFSDTSRMIFDEFQSEVNHYCDNEIRKFISIHTSVARGAGAQIRYVPVIMISNPVSLINPYYTELGIASRLTNETRFLRGHGYVLEQGYVESAAAAQESSLFNKAFSGNDYMLYNNQGVYLNDNQAFIDKPKGSGRYMATIKYLGKEYAIRSYPDQGIVYCDHNVDGSFKFRISVTTDDHNVNYVMLKANDIFIWNMKYYFEHGSFRFKDLYCKEAVIKLIS